MRILTQWLPLALLSTVLMVPAALAGSDSKDKDKKSHHDHKGKHERHERGKLAYKKALASALASEKIEAKHKYDLDFNMSGLQWVTRDHTDYKNGTLLIGFTSHGAAGTGEANRVDQGGEDPVAFDKGAVRIRLASRKADSTTLKDCEDKARSALKSGQKMHLKISALPKYSVFVSPREFLYAYARDLMEEKILKWLSDFEGRNKDRKRLDKGTKALAELAGQVAIRRSIGVNVDLYAVSCELK